MCGKRARRPEAEWVQGALPYDLKSQGNGVITKGKRVSGTSIELSPIGIARLFEALY